MTQAMPFLEMMRLEPRQSTRFITLTVFIIYCQILTLQLVRVQHVLRVAYDTIFRLFLKFMVEGNSEDAMFNTVLHELLLANLIQSVLG